MNSLATFAYGGENILMDAIEHHIRTINKDSCFKCLFPALGRLGAVGDNLLTLSVFRVCVRWFVDNGYTSIANYRGILGWFTHDARAIEKPDTSQMWDTLSSVKVIVVGILR